MRVSCLGARQDAKHTYPCATVVSRIIPSSWAQHGHHTRCDIPLCRSHLRYVGVGRPQGHTGAREPIREREVKRPTIIRSDHVFALLRDYCVRCRRSRFDIVDGDLNCVVEIIT